VISTGATLPRPMRLLSLHPCDTSVLRLGMIRGNTNHSAETGCRTLTVSLPYPQDVSIELGSPVVGVSIDARRPEVAAVGLESGPPVLVTFADRSGRPLPTVDLGACPLATRQAMKKARGAKATARLGTISGSRCVRVSVRVRCCSITLRMAGSLQSLLLCKRKTLVRKPLPLQMAVQLGGLSSSVASSGSRMSSGHVGSPLSSP